MGTVLLFDFDGTTELSCDAIQERVGELNTLRDLISYLMVTTMQAHVRRRHL